MASIMIALCRVLAFIAIYSTQLRTAKGLLLNSPENAPSQPISNIATRGEREKAVVVGGGPVGLASAIVLANHGYDVSIFEATPTEEIKTFNPALAYLYNINARGQVFTKMVPNIHEKLLERSVSSSQTGFMLSPADASKDIDYSEGRFISVDESYWIPRHEMTSLFWEAVGEHNKSRKQNTAVGKIDFEQGVTCVGVSPNINGENSITVIVKDIISGDEKMVEGKLIVGADGIKSKVRQSLKEKSSRFETWDYNVKKFQIKKWVTAATGLKLKSLQVPANRYTIRDADGYKTATKNNDFVIVRGKGDGPFDTMSLKSLPMRTSAIIRTVNCITRPNHVLWTLKTGAQAKLWFTDNYPRLDFDTLISYEEWDRFAKAQGLSFPPCQYCPGLQASSSNGECGIVLVGDAAHSFSPDIGQGINAGLMDVVQLKETLESAVNSSENRSTKLSQILGTALKEYERIRAPETKALIRIARFGSPYQYGQPLRKDRIGKKLYTANVILRLLLNKVTLGLFPKQMIFMVNKKEMSYRQIARKADLGTAGLISIFTFAVFKLLVK